MRKAIKQGSKVKINKQWGSKGRLNRVKVATQDV